MVEVNGKSIIERQLDTIRNCGVRDEDIAIVTGYCSDVLSNRFKDTAISFVRNEKFETTNMVYSLMCAEKAMESDSDIVVSYGDIIYDETVFRKVMDAGDELSVIVDDGWYEYWSQRNENPLDDAETLMFDSDDYLTEIGQRTKELDRIQSQYIGLMRFRGKGVEKVLALSAEAKRRSGQGEPLWKTDRSYSRMYMTDLLQGMIEEGHKLRAVHINRGWYEIDDGNDLKIAEAGIK
jgi:Predicted sugar nucleotidyltransferases